MKLLPSTLLLVALAACRTAEPREHDLEIDVANAWTAPGDAEGQELLGDWLGSFGDPHLPGLVAEALERNRDLRRARAHLDAAAAQAEIAGASLAPTVRAGLNGSRQKQNFIGLADAFPGGGPGGGGVPSATFNNFGVSLDVSWEADLWGRLRAQEGAAEADFAAAAFDYEGARLSLAGQTAKAWFALCEARLQRDLAQRTVESFERSSAVVRDRFESGLRSALDVRLADLELATATGALALREERLDRTRRQLEVLVGRYPAGELEESAALPNLPPPVPVGLPADLLARRPDLRAAETRLAAADLRIEEAEAAKLPGLRLTASGGTASDDLGDLVDGDFTVWSLAAGLVQPIFEGGRLDARVDAASANSRAALASWSGAVLAAFAEVESALAGESFLARREASARQAMEQARAAESIADDRYRSGLTDVITLLLSKRSAIDSESAWITTRRTRLETRVDLHLALGGAFDVPDDEHRAPPTESEAAASSDLEPQS